MTKFFVADDSGLPFVPEGKYKAKFIGYEEKKGLAYGDAIKMNFEISEGEYEKTQLNHLVADKSSIQSKLAKDIRALLGGKPLKVGEKTDLDSLIGSLCIIVVVTEEGKAGYSDFSTISEVKPLAKDDLPF